jgi:hypothetical protein
MFICGLFRLIGGGCFRGCVSVHCNEGVVMEDFDFGPAAFRFISYQKFDNFLGD